MTDGWKTTDAVSTPNSILETYPALNGKVTKIDQSASVSAFANYRMKGHIELNYTSQYPHPHTHSHPHFYRWRDHIFVDAN